MHRDTARGAGTGVIGMFFLVLWVKSRDAGKPIAEFSLDAVPTYDGLAVADRRVYVSMQDGTIACFAK
ncbi:MAG: hypothetical protein ABSF26_00020 [Thermoguttaceae bacterium]